MMFADRLVLLQLMETFMTGKDDKETVKKLIEYF